MIDASLCWLPFSYLTTPECSPLMKRHIEIILTLIWHHVSVSLEAFRNFCETTERLPSLGRVGSRLWRLYFDLLSSSPFARLRLRLSLFHQTALQYSEPLALCALHIIFIWSMKADGMPSSRSQWSLDWIYAVLTGWIWHGDIIAQKMQILWYSLLRLFSILHHYYYSRPSSKLHPIRASVSTFILAEFNYSFSLSAFSFSLSFIQKPWKRFYHFS